MNSKSKCLYCNSELNTHADETKTRKIICRIDPEEYYYYFVQCPVCGIAHLKFKKK